MEKSASVLRIEKIAKTLSNLSEKLIFTGGSTLEFYADQARNFRQTDDVDCIVLVSTRTEYAKFEEKIDKLGFVGAALKGRKGSICTYVYQDLLVDFMPLNEQILGFKNSWFAGAVENYLEIDPGLRIKIPDAPHFLGIKIETMFNRAGSDLRFSHDLEDIVSVLDYRAKIVAEVDKAPEKLKKYISRSFRDKLLDKYFIEELEACAPEGMEQAERVYEKIKQIVAMEGKRPV